MGLSPCPGTAATAAPLADFFTSTGTPTDSIVVSAPGNGATIAGAVHLIASASESQPICQTQVWDNGKKLGVYSDQIDAIYNLAPGIHTTTVLDMDSAYKDIHKVSVTYTVQALVNGVQVITPAPNETFSPPTIQVVAHANESVPISQMQVWDNGVKLGRYSGADVNQHFSLEPGSHTITVTDHDDNYNVLHQSSVTYFVE
jgi:predicted heme/steroid binding protein